MADSCQCAKCPDPVAQVEDQPLPGTSKKTRKPKAQAQAVEREALPPAVAAFEKCDIRVTQIVECAVADFSDKLLVMRLAIGNDEVREFAAGISKFYTPEQVLNKKIVAICNVKPRPLAGGAVTSAAMLFAGSYGAEGSTEKEHVVLCWPPQDAEVGTRIAPEGYAEKLGEPNANPKKHFDKMLEHLCAKDGKMCLDGIPLVAGTHGCITCDCPDGSHIG